jgi:hypothetical protein
LPTRAKRPCAKCGRGQLNGFARNVTRSSRSTSASTIGHGTKQPRLTSTSIRYASIVSPKTRRQSHGSSTILSGIEATKRAANGEPIALDEMKEAKMIVDTIDGGNYDNAVNAFKGLLPIATWVGEDRFVSVLEAIFTALRGSKRQAFRVTQAIEAVPELTTK